MRRTGVAPKAHADAKTGAAAQLMKTVKMPERLHARAFRFGLSQRPRVYVTAIVAEAVEEYLKKRGA